MRTTRRFRGAACHLKTAAGGMRDQALGNLDALTARRQNVPESGELIAPNAGSRPARVTTEQTRSEHIGCGPSGRGSRRRGYDYRLDPRRLKT
jgi:hypothetical protein